MKHPVDTSKWGEFVVGELFELTGIKQVKSQHHVVEDPNGIPFVVQSNKNNMVKMKADKQWLIDNDEPVVEGNAIVLGVTLPVVSYQPYEFGASQVILLAQNTSMNFEDYLLPQLSTRLLFRNIHTSINQAFKNTNKTLSHSPQTIHRPIQL